MSSLAPTAAAVLVLGVALVGLAGTRPNAEPPTAAAAITRPPDGSLAAATSGLPPEPDGGWSGAVRYAWPTGDPAPVLRGFDPPPVRWGSGHRGVDLALDVGAPVLAAGAGTVAFAGDVAGRPVLSILHADGIRTTYEPVTPVVPAGARVAAGQVVGHLAATTHCGGVSCLHWGARRGADAYLDPLGLLRDRLVRLYPVG